MNASHCLKSALCQNITMGVTSLSLFAVRLDLCREVRDLGRRAAKSLFEIPPSQVESDLRPVQRLKCPLTNRHCAEPV